MNTDRDIPILRELASQYAEIAALPVQEERRKLWSRKHALKRVRPLVLVTYGMHNVWCRDLFNEHVLQCADPFYRAHELNLRLALFHHAIGDDFIIEPWITQRASLVGNGGKPWGVAMGQVRPDIKGGAWKFDPPLKSWDDMRKLIAPHHRVDEAATARSIRKLQDAIGDILTVNVDRGPLCQGFAADISTHLARLRGLEQLMIDMCESPRELHALLSFMRDGILANQAEAEQAGDYSLTTQHNQDMVYCDELEPPRANSGPRLRKDLWCFSAAQEYTLVSPQMHDEFLLQYQLPIMKNFRLTAYGCCENLTGKIAMLGQIPNLRRIAVTPTADVRRCAEQIGADYVFSWRPNPANMVCCGWDEAKISRIIRDGLEAAKGCHVVIHLKDVETVEGDPDRLARWVKIVRNISEEYV